eukprot:6458094-Amphidinium_carterae.1
MAVERICTALHCKKWCQKRESSVYQFSKLACRIVWASRSRAVVVAGHQRHEEVGLWTKTSLHRPLLSHSSEKPIFRWPWQRTFELLGVGIGGSTPHSNNALAG